MHTLFTIFVLKIATAYCVGRCSCSSRVKLKFSMAFVTLLQHKRSTTHCKKLFIRPFVSSLSTLTPTRNFEALFFKTSSSSPAGSPPTTRTASTHPDTGCGQTGGSAVSAQISAGTCSSACAARETGAMAAAACPPPPARAANSSSNSVMVI